MKKYFLFCFLITLFSFGQEEMTISGYVKDKETGEVLIGANVVVLELSAGRSTNNYGFFSITIPVGEFTIETSYIGYNNSSQLITPANSTQNLNFFLQRTSFLTEEVVIKAKKEDANIQSSDMGKIELEVEKVDQLPV